MENIINKVENPQNEEDTVTIKEPVKKLSDRDLNNNLILDTLVKTTKAIQHINFIMDLNNIADLGITITPDDYKEIQDATLNLVTLIQKQTDKFNKRYMEIKNEMELNKTSNDSNLQESENN